MFEENRILVARYSMIAYHAILFGSFAVTVYFLPKIQEIIPKYVNIAMLQQPASYLAAYLLAMYIVPTILFFMIAQSIKTEV